MTNSSFIPLTKAEWIKETKGFAIAFAVAMLIRTFFYQPFMIPSESMYPTLVVGDFIFVNKFTYGFSNQSLPLSPNVIQKDRIFEGELKRGDVVVFHNPNHLNEKRQVEAVDYIKRLIGLPGDRIQMINGILHINGKEVPLERGKDYDMRHVDGRNEVIPYYIETLPNGVKHPILKIQDFGNGSLDNTQEFTVPKDHFFMMGDNRDNSTDSRDKKVGFIPLKRIVGRADLILLSHIGTLIKPWTWLNLRLDRFPHLIR
ncbi:MAG: signal peptidase I [Candidatus Puniceispirillum sp.]|nr:signal peptidase I [Candidatus Pelagibacter sp.]MBA4283627.1 signal peptidase I [Candidatus Puniceispirillum sp.]